MAHPFSRCLPWKILKEREFMLYISLGKKEYIKTFMKLIDLNTDSLFILAKQFQEIGVKVAYQQVLLKNYIVDYVIIQKV